MSQDGKRKQDKQVINKLASKQGSVMALDSVRALVSCFDFLSSLPSVGYVSQISPPPLLQLDQSWTSKLITIYCKKKILQWNLGDALIYEYDAIYN